MAVYVKFNDFVNQLMSLKHDLSGPGHVVKACLSNTAPSASLNTVKADITEITAGNGYTAGGTDIQNAFTAASGTVTETAVNVVWTAAGGTIGPFRYVVTYNDTQTIPAKPLVNYWDYGSSITLNDTETFTVAFGASWFTLA